MTLWSNIALDKIYSENLMDLAPGKELESEVLDRSTVEKQWLTCYSCAMYS